MENQVKKSTSNIQYLTVGNNGKISFSGFCKLQMNALSKYLTVDPLADDIKPIGASFEWTFIKEKHLLCVISPNNDQDFILVFKNASTCRRVFAAIFEYKTNVTSVLDQQQTYQERFLLPLFSELADRNIVSILSHLIEAHSTREKLNLVEFLKQKNLYEAAFSKLGDQLDVAAKIGILENECSPDSQERQTRKRKHAEIGKSKDGENVKRFFTGVDNRIVRKRAKEYTKVIHSPQFKLMYASKLFCPRRLIIYTSPEHTQFHTYKCCVKNRTFVCIQCKQKSTAIIEVDENGEIQAKLTADKHLCKLFEVIPKNYIETTIVKKSNYKIFERVNSNNLLIILDSDNDTYCYEYAFDSSKQKFLCRGCCTVLSKRKKRSKARIYYEGTENEYVEILNVEHICEKRLYEPKKYQQCKEFVLRPDFEIHGVTMNGQETKKLIIFDSKNKNLCYYYSFIAFQGYFYCEECKKLGKNLRAKLQKNSDGEEYILLLHTNHCCELQKYVPPPKDIILRPPDIEYMEETKTGLPKLFVFDKSDRKKCYIFSSRTHALRNCMHCLRCMKKYSASVTGYFCNDNGNCTFRIKSDQKHLCQPRIYNPNEFQSLKTYDFFYYRQRNKPQSLELAIYHHSDKNLCFTFVYRKCKNSFRCIKCERKKKCVIISIKKDVNGNEYFEHDRKKHVCQPIKVSSISGREFIKLNNGNIHQNTKAVDLAAPSIDESKIIRKPNFDLEPNLHGVLDKVLNIFYAEDKSLVYQYRNHHGNLFICRNCEKQKRTVNAKLYTDGNGEKYIVLGETEHVCKPAEYKPSRKIVESSNYKIINQDGESKSTKLIVFTTPSHEFCYVYTYGNGRKCFSCNSCHFISTKCVSAKLIKKENNEEYVLLSGAEHVCKPKKFEPGKFEQQNIITIPATLFELHENKSGEKDKKLIIFTSEKKEMHYNYGWRKNNSYLCHACSNRKNFIYAKLKENESGEKYIETKDLSEHVCKPQKYEKEKFEEKVIVPKSMFHLCKNTKGEKDKQLFIFTSEKKDMAYKYSFSQNKFMCLGCHKQKTWVAAKLEEDQNGEHFVELLSAKHVCKPQNYEKFEETVIITKSMFQLCENEKGEKDKHLLLFTTEEKDFAYRYSLYGSAYVCIKCNSMKKRITAKLKEDENGEKCVELLSTIHVCKPLKL